MTKPAMPGWIYEMGPDVYVHQARLELALEVALEAMRANLDLHPSFSIIKRDGILTDAIRKIERMGERE